MTTISKEYELYNALFLILKNIIVKTDKNNLNKKDIYELQNHLKNWGVYGNRHDYERLKTYYVENYENNLLKKCDKPKNQLNEYKYEVIALRKNGKHLNFLKVIYEESCKQIIYLEKKNYNKLRLSVTEFRTIMKFLPLDKVYDFHVSRINYDDLIDFVKIIKVASKNIDLVVATEKSGRIIGELLDIKNIIFLTPDPITREKNFDLISLFNKEFNNLYLGKSVLIIEEFIQTGDTFGKLSKFFKKLGFKEVYTYTMYQAKNCKYKPTFVLKKGDLAPPWYDFPIMLREKIPGSFKTKKLTFNSKVLEQRLKDKKTKLMTKLKKEIN